MHHTSHHTRLVSVFGSSRVQPGDPLYDEALSWGHAIGEAGFGVATGGYGGAMEAVSRGVRERDQLVVGVTAPALFPERVHCNRYVDVEIPAPTLTSRIERLLDMGWAWIVLPGGVGTLAELVLAWTTRYVSGNAGRQSKRLGVHPDWMGVIGPGLEIGQEQVDLIEPIDDLDTLRRFLEHVTGDAPI